MTEDLSAMSQRQHGDKTLRDKTPLDFYESLETCRELCSAENAAQVEESRELEILRASREPA